jgi:hypothetical protein
MKERRCAVENVCTSEDRLLGHFAKEFSASLANIKFFVLPARVSVGELADEVCKFEEAVRDNKSTSVSSIDKDCVTVAFNAPFV